MIDFDETTYEFKWSLKEWKEIYGDLDPEDLKKAVKKVKWGGEIVRGFFYKTFREYATSLGTIKFQRQKIKRLLKEKEELVNRLNHIQKKAKEFIEGKNII